MKLKTLLLSAAFCCTLLPACGPEEQAPAGVPDIPVYQTGAQNIPIHQEFVGQVYGFKDIASKSASN